MKRDLLMVDVAYRDAFLALGLRTCRDTEKYFCSPLVERGHGVVVMPANLGLPDGSALPVYYKEYNYRRRSYEFWGRSSKARCEYDNYAVFRALGIRCAERIATGEERDWMGRLERAIIVTRAVPGALPMVEFFKQRSPPRQVRATVCRKLAEMAATIHHAHFFHNDLVLRNVLVTWDPPSDPIVWWIDCPRGHFKRMPLGRHRALIKDIASLDKAGSKLLTACERVAFIRHYAGTMRLTVENKQLVRDVMNYRRRRWTDDFR
jgi:tRNA A-37 threonylcarbamoyl transferase component Bud32